MDEDPVSCQSYRMSELLSSSSSWFPSQDEGQLSVDIFREGETLVIHSPVAGVAIEDIDIAIHGDLLTIRGTRTQRHTTNEDDWFCRECYWGAFSRSIVLPLDVQADHAEATMKNGVLEIRIPLRHIGHRIQVRHQE